MKKLLVILLSIICVFGAVLTVGCDNPETPTNPDVEQEGGQTGTGDGSNGGDTDNDGVELPGEIFSLI